MIVNDTKLNSAHQSAHPTRLKSLSMPYLINAEGVHTPHTDLFVGVEMEGVFDQKLKD